MDIEGLHTYESIGQSQQKANTQDTPATPTPARGEASKEEVFFVAVNKKVSKDGVGGGAELERAEPQSES